jgi:hypothetical protein
VYTLDLGWFEGFEWEDLNGGGRGLEWVYTPDLVGRIANFDCDFDTVCRKLN